MRLDELPIGIWVELARHLTVEDVGRLTCTCVSLRIALNDDRVWSWRVKDVVERGLVDPRVDEICARLGANAFKELSPKEVFQMFTKSRPSFEVVLFFSPEVDRATAVEAIMECARVSKPVALLRALKIGHPLFRSEPKGAEEDDPNSNRPRGVVAVWPNRALAETSCASLRARRLDCIVRRMYDLSDGELEKHVRRVCGLANETNECVIF